MNQSSTTNCKRDKRLIVNIWTLRGLTFALLALRTGTEEQNLIERFGDQ
jgi:hypothetical protein